MTVETTVMKKIAVSYNTKFKRIFSLHSAQCNSLGYNCITHLKHLFSISKILFQILHHAMWDNSDAQMHFAFHFHIIVTDIEIVLMEVTRQIVQQLHVLKISSYVQKGHPKENQNAFPGLSSVTARRIVKILQMKKQLAVSFIFINAMQRITVPNMADFFFLSNNNYLNLNINNEKRLFLKAICQNQ